MGDNTGQYLKDLGKNMLKYFTEGLLVAIAAYAIPAKSLRMEEILLIALTAAATISVLDTYLPYVTRNKDGTPDDAGKAVHTQYMDALRKGAGMGIGANLVGFPRI